MEHCVCRMQRGFWYILSSAWRLREFTSILGLPTLKELFFSHFLVSPNCPVKHQSSYHTVCTTMLKLKKVICQGDIAVCTNLGILGRGPDPSIYGLFAFTPIKRPLDVLFAWFVNCSYCSMIQRRPLHFWIMQTHIFWLINNLYFLASSMCLRFNSCQGSIESYLQPIHTRNAYLFSWAYCQLWMHQGKI